MTDSAGSPNILRIATRGSDLALTQTRHIAARLERELSVTTELVVLRTTGDRIQDRSLAKIGGKGLFVKEIEEALLDGRADVAVHSAKDVPARIADGCVIAAHPEREDPRAALASKIRGQGVDDLREGARVGTGSTRRMALLRAHRPDLELVPLRGNVPTRLAKIQEDDLDAVVLACAGLDRLGLTESIDERIAPEILLPAVGQGLLALETREGDLWQAVIRCRIDADSAHDELDRIDPHIPPSCRDADLTSTRSCVDTRLRRRRARLLHRPSLQSRQPL